MTGGQKIGVGFLVGGIVAAIGGGIALAFSGRSGALGGSVQMMRARGAAGFKPVYTKGSRAGLLREYRRDDFSTPDRIRLIDERIAVGMRDPAMRKLALAVTNHCEARDDACELQAVYDYVKTNVRYTGDAGAYVHYDAKGNPVYEQADVFQSPQRTLEYRGGDCFTQGTLMLGTGHELLPVESVREGMKIWGRDRWSEVQRAWYKGILPVSAIFLNNGSKMMLTEDHHVFAAICRRDSHPHGESALKCYCPVSEREIVRITVSELEPGMVLITPNKLPFGQQSMDPGRAYVEGLYLSDGWAEGSRFAISGRDGCPKEEQKREVENICQRLGVDTRWHERYIAVNDSEWTHRMEQMGHRAWLKHALTIDLDETTAREYLRGIMADSGANTRGKGRTFTSTSRMLAIQMRMLWKMFGRTCGERYVADHGGLGEHPVWRMQIRTKPEERADGHAEKLLRVKAIEREVMSLPVYDLTTDDHYVYLPEADVTVSQCDDHQGVVGTLLAWNGFDIRKKVTAPTANAPDAHIYIEAKRRVNWTALDTTLPYASGPGTEHPYGRASVWPGPNGVAPKASPALNARLARTR